MKLECRAPKDNPFIPESFSGEEVTVTADRVSHTIDHRSFQASTYSLFGPPGLTIYEACLYKKKLWTRGCPVIDEDHFVAGFYHITTRIVGAVIGSKVSAEQFGLKLCDLSRNGWSETSCITTENVLENLSHNNWDMSSHAIKYPLERKPEAKERRTTVNWSSKTAGRKGEGVSGVDGPRKKSPRKPKPIKKTKVDDVELDSESGESNREIPRPSMKKSQEVLHKRFKELPPSPPELEISPRREQLQCDAIPGSVTKEEVASIVRKMQDKFVQDLRKELKGSGAR